MTLGFDEDGPARAETPERVVQAAGDANQFGWHSRVQIRPSEPGRALKRAVLVENDALIDQGRPRQEIRELGGGAPIFCKVHHDQPQTPKKLEIRRCRRTTSTNCGSRLAAHTAAAWPITPSTRPASQSRRPSRSCW